MKRGHPPAPQGRKGRPAREADTSGCSRGLVVSTHGRHVVVEPEEGPRLICPPRGKKSEAVVGDRVLWQHTLDGGDEGVIVQVEPRSRLVRARRANWMNLTIAPLLPMSPAAMRPKKK